MPPPSLEWVDCGPDGQSITDVSRKTIRTKAMDRAAAARKETGSWGQLNTRQYPINFKAPSHTKRCGYSRSRGNHPSPARKTQEIPHESPKRMYGPPEAGICPDGALLSLDEVYRAPCRSMPVRGIERLTVDTGINILDLNELTLIHMGHAAGLLLSKEPGILNRLIGRWRMSYLSHVPKRYGNTPCLDDAVRCVCMKAKRLLVPAYSAPLEMEFSLYGKALRGLQSLIEDPRRWSSPDVLCAVQVLSLYELIDFPTRTGAWEQHVAAAMRLISLRGPSQFTTDYEKSLLLSMVAPFICECLRTQQPCFLEEERWQQTLLSAADPSETFTPRSIIATRLSIVCSKLPRLFNETAKAALDPVLVSPRSLDRIEAELLGIEEAICAWQNDYDLLVYTSAQTAVSSIEQDHRMQLRAASLGMLAMTNRLLSAVCIDRRGTEERAVANVRRMKCHIDSVVSSNPWVGFYLGQKVVLPASILQSTEVWLLPASSNRIVEKYQFQAWMDAIMGQFKK
ncbi:hypothetical protein F5Y15DRAFT_105856 [Xylariaceae sp. FL0016]|nr:hypothetical protein F5Y15DRAFT_105856 [Xylariaceae sp. FL0016]